jgi:hypothetical protein
VNGALSHGLAPLAVRGNRIVDTVTGAIQWLRGINRSGFEYTFAPTIGDAESEHIVREWGARIVRLPFNQEWALTREDYRMAMDAAIDGFAVRGAYTLLDLQWLDNHTVRGYDRDGNPNFVPPLPDDDTVELWRSLATRYNDEPAVLFDLLNEPHDPLPGDDLAPTPRVGMREWQPVAAALTGAIRAIHPAALIFISGIDWAYNLDGFPIPTLEGVVYSTHVYVDKKPGWDEAFGALSATHPVFAGEWGGGDKDLDWGARLAAYFRDRGIGWTAWGWPDKPPLLDAAGNPTAFGGLVRNALR